MAEDEHEIFEYEVSEKVYVYYQGVPYKARVIEKETMEDSEQLRYKVHYDGWNKNHDHWATADIILKFTPENEEKCKRLLQEAKAKAAEEEAKKRRSRPESRQRSRKSQQQQQLTPEEEEEENERNEKRKRGDEEGANDHDASSQTNPGSPAPPGMKKSRFDMPGHAAGSSGHASSQSRPKDLRIPKVLQEQLVDDWHLVSQRRVVPLPRKPSVSTILDDFVKTKDKSRRAGLKDFCEGVKALFCYSVGTILLYPIERVQYADLVNPQKDDAAKQGGKSDAREREERIERLADVYGAEHLLRLFVRLPELLAANKDISPKDAQLQKEQLSELLEYLERNTSTLFVAEYNPIAPQYNRLSDFFCGT